MGFLIDTNLLSEARKGATIDRNVETWLEEQKGRDQFLSVVTIMEIEIGVLRLDRRDPVQARILREWLEGWVLPTFDQRILPFTLATARLCAVFHVPDRKPDRDAMIAATAKVHGLVVATRNVRDFAAMDVAVFNPWAAA